MLCDKCKQRQATVRVTKILNNQKTEANYCAECAQLESGLALGGPMLSVHDFMKGFFGPASAGAKPQAGRCPVCNQSFSELVQRGRFGCSQCYATFREAAPDLVRRIHGAKRHSGKLPRRACGAVALQQEMTGLRQQLSEHVAKEEYEEAAKVRDRIRALEKRLGGTEGGRAL